MDISLQLSMLLWISIWKSVDFYGYPCIEMLWILDPGLTAIYKLNHQAGKLPFGLTKTLWKG